MVGFIIAIILAAVDFIAGDLNELRNYKLVCSYEIFDILSERIYVCRRKGAQHLEEVYGSRGIVNELITGKTWNSSFHLIADIHGILMELRPMTPDDWWLIKREFHHKQAPMYFIGLDVFDKRCPDIDA